MKPVVRRAKADGDIDNALTYFLENAPEYAYDFVDSLEQAYLHIQQFPDSGSSRYAHDLNLPGLKFWICDRFQYLIFYVERATAIEVWRVLHANQDIPETLRIGTSD